MIYALCHELSCCVGLLNGFFNFITICFQHATFGIVVWYYVQKVSQMQTNSILIKSSHFSPSPNLDLHFPVLFYWNYFQWQTHVFEQLFFTFLPQYVSHKCLYSRPIKLIKSYNKNEWCKIKKRMEKNRKELYNWYFPRF